jgi:hypothetical protein
VFDLGIEEHGIEHHTVRIYSVARTVADCFRFGNKIGLDVALKALTGAWRSKRLNLDELKRVATKLRLQRVMQPYVEQSSSERILDSGRLCPRRPSPFQTPSTISALRFGGKPKQLLALAIDGQVDLAVPEAIIAETLRVLRDKFQAHQGCPRSARRFAALTRAMRSRKAWHLSERRG